MNFIIIEIFDDIVRYRLLILKISAEMSFFIKYIYYSWFQCNLYTLLLRKKCLKHNSAFNSAFMTPIVHLVHFSANSAQKKFVSYCFWILTLSRSWKYPIVHIHFLIVHLVHFEDSNNTYIYMFQFRITAYDYLIVLIYITVY